LEKRPAREKGGGKEAARGEGRRNDLSKRVKSDTDVSSSGKKEYELVVEEKKRGRRGRFIRP